MTAWELAVLRFLALGWDCAAHRCGVGAEAAYGEEALDELASEVGRDVEPGSGDGRGPAGCVEV